MTDPQPLAGDELATIKARAEAATPGPWIVAERRDKSYCGIDYLDGFDEVIAPGRVECSSYCYGGTSVIDAKDEDWRHIAGMDPATTLRLVAEIERLREERAAIDPLDWPGEAHRLQAALHFARGTIEDLSRTVERMDAENCGCVNP